MKRAIRRGTFETNSSSTHALAIKLEQPKNFPKEVFFSLGQFGWEEDFIWDYSTKAAYFHTAIYDNFGDNEEKYNEIINKVTQDLKARGVEATWRKVGVGKNFGEDRDEWFYIDHGYELDTIINAFLDSPDLLFEWLFNQDSVLITSNDNSDGEWFENKCEAYDGNPDYCFYYKGN